MGTRIITPPCAKGKTDCFAWSKGNCTVLTNTLFGRRKCPFYKPDRQRRAELKELERKKT